MKRSFVRVLWGTYNENIRHSRHRNKINNDIRLSTYNKYSPKYATYVFGDDNYKHLIDLGIDCKLVDKRAFVWDAQKEQFRHKLEAFKFGMEEFDEIVYVDIDTMPVKCIPENLWSVLRQKQAIQAILRMYHRKKACWRKTDMRKIPCAAFVYIRDKSIPYKLIDIWEKIGKPWTEETVMAIYTDDVLGGWLGVEKYWDAFEPDFFALLDGCTVYPEELMSKKNICFKHFTPPQRCK